MGALIDRDDLMTAVRAYAGRDDWEVENIYLRTLGHLIDQLAAGLSAADIAAHASHTGQDDCPIARLMPALAD